MADRLWEDLVLAIIGDQFEDCRPPTGEVRAEDDSDPGSEWPEICGCTISVRQSEDIVSLWNHTDLDLKLREKIRCVLRGQFVVYDINQGTWQGYNAQSSQLAAIYHHGIQVKQWYVFLCICFKKGFMLSNYF